MARLSEDEAPEREVVLHGETICPGIAVGSVFVLEPEFIIHRTEVSPVQVGREQARYTEAERLVQDQFAERVRKIKDTSPSEAAIFSAFQAMLSDQEFQRSVLERIAREQVNAEWALEEEVEKLIRIFDAMPDPYLKARAEDVRGLSDSILRALSRTHQPQAGAFVAPEKGQVLVSRHLFPRAAMQAQHVGAAGFATESVALFAHAAILLKGFRIPSVGAVAGLGAVVLDGDVILVNGDEAIVVVRPSPETIQEHTAPARRTLHTHEPRPETGWTTKDGTLVHLLANIESPEQLQFAYESGLEGVGLFRTEFLALTRGSIPSEQDQIDTYTAVIQQSAARKVLIRTFDIGADKQSPTLYRNLGRNPAMGSRGIRRHLRNELAEFKTQVRAILRAAASSDSDVGIMLPVVTNVGEIRLARTHIEDVKAELEQSSMPFSRTCRLGVMIEVPAAAIAISEMLAVIDFVSVGSNDLLQHFMAADRDNEDVLEFNNFEDPAFLWLMRRIIDGAAAMGRAGDVSVCGEAASSPKHVLTMLSLGFRTFSIAPVALSRVQQALQHADLRELPSDPNSSYSGVQNDVSR